MKKLLFIAAVTSVVMMLTPVGSGAVTKPVTPKTGASCSPIGKSQTIGNKKYTCVKSGKKLVWSKPATLKKPTPTPSPSVAPVTKPTLDALDTLGVYQYSRASVAEAIAKNGESNLNFRYLIGPNVSLQVVDSVKSDMRKAIDLWGNSFSASDRFTVIWYVQQDLEWAADTYRTETGNPVEWTNINSSCTISFCGNATASKARNGTYVFEQGMTLDRNGWNRATAGHEFTHLAQNKIAGQNMYKMPLWLLEGSAQFYGEATGYHPADSSKSMRRGMHAQFARDAKPFITSKFEVDSLKDVLSARKSSDVLQLMRSVEFESRDYPRTALAYLLGGYASEALVAVYGHEKFVELYKSFATSVDWEANFLSVYGISTSTFYEKLAPYLYLMLEEM